MIEAFGVVPSKVDIRDYRVAAVTNVEFPAEFKLPVRAVKNQNAVGSCVAHALAEVVEYFNCIQNKRDIAMSTQFIYGNRMNSKHKGTGMVMRDALANLQLYGTCPNGIMAGNYEVPEAIEKFESEALSVVPQAYPNRITRYCRLHNDSDMKLWLTTKGPIVFSIPWKKPYYLTKDYVLTPGPGETKVESYHCMMIYGWNEKGWLFQNSWGTYWADGGRAIYPYDGDFSEVWGVEDTCYDTYKDELVRQLNQQITELTNKLSEAQALLAQKQEEIITLQEQINETAHLTEQEIKALREQQDAAVAQVEKATQELADMMLQLEDLKIQNQLLEETIVEIQKPYKGWPTWVVHIVNFILNLFKKKGK